VRDIEVLLIDRGQKQEPLSLNAQLTQAFFEMEHLTTEDEREGSARIVVRLADELLNQSGRSCAGTRRLFKERKAAAMAMLAGTASAG
jgi:hypothetical protein